MTLRILGSSSSGGGGAPSGSASGDLSGTYPGPTVGKINGSPLGSMGTPSSNQGLLWNGSAWVPTTITSAIVGALAASNNLSDLGSASTARTNLGLGTAATTAASAYDTAGAASTAQSAAIAASLGLRAMTFRESTMKPTAAIIETYPRASDYIGGSLAITTGQLALAAIPVPTGTVVSNITFNSAATAAGTPTHWWFGLFDNSFNLLAVTADQTTTAWGSVTKKTLAVATTAAGASSTFTTTYSGIHYLGICVVATTTPTIVGSSAGSATSVLGDLPLIAPFGTGSLTAPPTFPFTSTATTNTSPGLFYGYLS